MVTSENFSLGLYLSFRIINEKKVRIYSGGLVNIRFNSSGNQILAELVWAEFVSPQVFLSTQQRHQLSMQTGFDRLLALEALPHITLYPHQQETVLKVLRDMGGRAVLADEVGLGKTIEAGVIMKEYLLRALVKRILVLVPASLVSQWFEELNYTLKIPFQVQNGSLPWTTDLIIASIDYAKRDPHRSQILAQHYDLVVVDEAHKLKNAATQNWRFVNGIQKKFLLLLTATPIQNDLKELYNIITLLKPGQLKTYREFKREFIKDKRTPQNVEKLHLLLQEVVVRTSRRETLLNFPRRLVKTLVVERNTQEAEFAERTFNYLRQVYNRKDGASKSVLPLIVLAREVCSSPAAAVATLRKIIAKSGSITASERAELKEIVAIGQNIGLSAKAKELINLITSTSEKVLVFTEFLQTQTYLAQEITRVGIEVTVFHGGLTLAEKDAAINAFRHEKQVLISTEAGGEGRNLQFCHILVNYDLPWNPMRVEQRIGRIHRLGQTADVLIYNLITRKSIEEDIVYLLQEKLRLFTDVLGGLENIITSSGDSFEKIIADAFLGSRSRLEATCILKRLGDDLLSRRSAYVKLQKHTDQILGVRG
mgnify:CR=1 FL=1